MVLLLSLSGGMCAERNCRDSRILQFESVLVGFARGKERRTFTPSHAAWSLILTRSAALPSCYAVGYTLIKIGRANDRLDFAELHVLPDGIAHPRESDCYLPVFQFLDECDQLIAGADVD